MIGSKSADASLRPMIRNANDMSMFSGGSFDLVMSNAMLEHNPYFWKSIFEMNRVLASGGLLIIGVCIQPTDRLV